jgi:hypothetical protein
MYLCEHAFLDPSMYESRCTCSVNFTWFKLFSQRTHSKVPGTGLEAGKRASESTVGSRHASCTTAFSPELARPAAAAKVLSALPFKAPFSCRSRLFNSPCAMHRCSFVHETKQIFTIKCYTGLNTKGSLSNSGFQGRFRFLFPALPPAQFLLPVSALLRP